jgi:hypothetical protein
MHVVSSRRTRRSLPTEPSGRALRSRWAAIGAAVAVTIGSGGLLTTSASIGSGERGVFVPIAPCRLFDTRPAPDNVGPRATPLGPGDTLVAAARGTNGNCTIPNDAVGLTMNVVVINPTAASFLTVYPADVTRPLASNLNWVGGQSPTPNAVTTDIAGDGSVAFYNLAGSVDVAADIVGYFVDHTHDDRYYTKAQVDMIANTSGARVARDTAGSVGGYNSIAIGVDGLPVISYLDDGAGDLKVAKCPNLTCTGVAAITTLDASGSVGYFTSIAIGTDGNPVVAYLDATNNDAKVAKCTNPACTGPATITTIDATGTVGYYTAIAIGADGNPVVSYYDVTNLDLKVAKCLNPACTGTSTITTVDAPGDVGAYSSITLGLSGNPMVAYLDTTNADLKVAACVNPACTGTSTTTTVDATGNMGYYASIKIAADGNPIVAHFDATNNDLRVSHCVNPLCTGVSVSTTIDSIGSVGQFVSVAIGRDGLPIISYTDSAASDLKVAACGSIDCTGAASISTLESTNVVGYYTSIAVGADGVPIISHQDVTNADLRIAKCSTVTCVS